MAKKNYTNEDTHSEELQDIISKPPSWLLKRGLTFILLTILMLFTLTIFIHYPEIVPVSMRFNTSNAPKIIVSKVKGNLIKILIKEGEWIEKGTNIAYLESIGDHDHVIDVLNRLLKIRSESSSLNGLEDLVSPLDLNLGELQSSYQTFYLSYLNYKSVNQNGILQKKKQMLYNEVKYINDQHTHLKESYELQRKELNLNEEEYRKYQQLADKKIISPLELQQKEAVLFSKRQSIPQIENTLISNRTSILSKERELSEINNQIVEDEKKFFQALNTFIFNAENWKKQYILSAQSSGYLIYGDFLQENQLVNVGDVLFYIHSGTEDYYGECFFPQVAYSKIKTQQDVIIKVRSYPYEEYGYLRGKVEYISAIPIKDSLFFSKVSIIRTDKDSLIKLKPGIFADAEIITEDKSIFKRLWGNLTKSLKLKSL